MKHLLFAWLLLVQTTLNAQPPQTMPKHSRGAETPTLQTIVKTKSLINQSVKLNGGLNRRFGGTSRTIIQIQIPLQTAEVHYSFTAKKDGEGAARLNLAIQLAGILANVSPGAKIFTGIAKSALNNVITPDGDIGINVYLLDANNAQAFENRTQFQYIPQGSATAASQGLITLKDLHEGTYYLGLENYNTISGVEINIEVVAIQSFAAHPPSNRN